MMYAYNNAGTPPLIYAIQQTNETKIELVKLLLSNSKCIGFMLNQKNSNNENVLYQAVEKRLRAIVKILIEYGAKSGSKDLKIVKFKITFLSNE